MKKAEKCQISSTKNFRFYCNLNSISNCREGKTNKNWFDVEFFLFFFLPLKSFDTCKSSENWKVVFFLRKNRHGWPANCYPNFLWLLCSIFLPSFAYTLERESTRKTGKKRKSDEFLPFFVTSLRIIYCISSLTEVEAVFWRTWEDELNKRKIWIELLQNNNNCLLHFCLKVKNWNFWFEFL